MFIQTHEKFSHYLYDDIKQNLNINLNKKFFTLGNIEPDLPFVYPSVRHYKNCNYSFIVQLITKLFEEGLQENNYSINQFSEKLGIINHYICDYFCFPHFNRKYYSRHLGEHLIYEKKLDAYFKQHYYCPNTHTNSFEKNVFCIEHICEHLEEKLNLYENTTPSFYADISHALDTVTELNTILINSIVYAPCTLGMNTI